MAGPSARDFFRNFDDYDGSLEKKLRKALTNNAKKLVTFFNYCRVYTMLRFGAFTASDSDVELVFLHSFESSTATVGLATTRLTARTRSVAFPNSASPDTSLE